MLQQGLDYGAELCCLPVLFPGGRGEKKEFIVDVSRDMGYDDISEILVREHTKRGVTC